MTAHGLTVIKYGGAALVQPEQRSQVLVELARQVAAGQQLLLVHGGGPEIESMLTRLGIQSRKIAGLRVTDAPTMEVVQMVLAGKVNKSLAAELGQYGCAAVGLSGQDNLLLRGERWAPEGADLGFVGKISSVNAAFLRQLLALKLLPILCSICTDAEGQALNVNADDAACEVACALGAERLVLLTDVVGVLAQYPDETSRIPQLTSAQARALLSSGKIASGMIPKIEACLNALERGVSEARIIDGRSAEPLRALLAGQQNLGTVFRND